MLCALEEQRDSIKAVVAAVDTYSAGNAFSPAGWIETSMRNTQKVRRDKQSMQVYIKKEEKSISDCLLSLFYSLSRLNFDFSRKERRCV